MTDPFRPVAPRLPAARLLRAGLTDEQVDALGERFADMSTRQKRDLVRYVNGHTDAAIAERFGADSTGTPTREQLDDLTVPELRDRLATRRQPIGGNKPDLIERLLDTYAASAPQGDGQGDGQGDTPDGAQQAAQGDDSGAQQQPEAPQVEGQPADGDTDGEQQAVVTTADGTEHTGELPPGAATDVQSAEGAVGEPPVTTEQPDAQPAPVPAPEAATTAPSGPDEQPAEQPVAPAKKAPAKKATAAQTPAAPAGGSTTTTGGTA